MRERLLRMKLDAVMKSTSGGGLHRMPREAADLAAPLQRVLAQQAVNETTCEEVARAGRVNDLADRGGLLLHHEP